MSSSHSGLPDGVTAAELGSLLDYSMLDDAGQRSFLESDISQDLVQAGARSSGRHQTIEGKVSFGKMCR